MIKLIKELVGKKGDSNCCNVVIKEVEESTNCCETTKEDSQNCCK